MSKKYGYQSDQILSHQKSYAKVEKYRKSTTYFLPVMKSTTNGTTPKKCLILRKKWVCWTLQVKYTTFWSVNDLRYTVYCPLKLTFSRYSRSRGVKCSVKWSKGVERCTGNTNKQSTSTWPESCSLLDGQISYSHHSQQTARFHPVITGRVWFHPAMTVQPDFLRSFVSI